ncbi:helix-turn-helix domain-containing protein [Streptomyces sp. NPDC094049]|uniref:helix-turn-helix domain-containing protein n=1 Tax=Streptomyces sp. NPDC094049 TaxID=3154987 RepID=UPI003332BDA7
MTIDAHTEPLPRLRRRRTGAGALPAPDERRRLRQTWQLSERQVAEAFGVTVTTVRSWESGRTSPNGRRGEAYSAFLRGLGQAEDARTARVPRTPTALVRARRSAGRAGRRHDTAARPHPHLHASPPSGAPVPPLPDTRRRPALPSGAPSQPVPTPVPVLIPSTSTPTPIPAPAPRGRVIGLAVGSPPDPVSPGRRRRWRRSATAAGVWTAVLYVLLTCPPPAPL